MKIIASIAMLFVAGMCIGITPALMIDGPPRNLVVAFFGLFVAVGVVLAGILCGILFYMEITRV